MICPGCRVSRLVPDLDGNFRTCGGGCGKRVSDESADKMVAQLQQLLETEMKFGAESLKDFLQLTAPVLGPQHYLTLIGTEGDPA